MNEREKEMTEMDQVISRLNEAAEYFWECRGNASFGSKAEEHFWEMQSAMREAAERLKAQEPRVMTLEEAMQWNAQKSYEKDPVYIENIHEPEHTWACLDDLSRSSCGWELRETNPNNGYGVSWRCWTSRPTDEQREAVKWNE